MAKSWAQLKTTSDEDLLAGHDRIAPDTYVGINYYTTELHHREVMRSAESVEAMTTQMLDATEAVETMTGEIKGYTRTMLIMNAVAVVIALVALLVGLFG